MDDYGRSKEKIYCRIWWLIHNEFMIRALKSKTGEMIFIIKCQALVKYIYSRSTLFSCSILCSIWWPSGYSNYKFNITYLPISVKKTSAFLCNQLLGRITSSWKVKLEKSGNWEVQCYKVFIEVGDCQFCRWIPKNFRNLLKILTCTIGTIRFFFYKLLWRIRNWKYCWQKELPYSLVYRLSWLHSTSAWQVQSAGCVVGTSATGSKWRLQLILCSCASVAWEPCTRKRNVRIENPIFCPNSVWTTLSLLLSAHNWLLRNECIAYISSSPWEISHDSILKLHWNRLTLVKFSKTPSERFTLMFT